MSIRYAIGLVLNRQHYVDTRIMQLETKVDDSTILQPFSSCVICNCLPIVTVVDPLSFLAPVNQESDGTRTAIESIYVVFERSFVR